LNILYTARGGVEGGELGHGRTSDGRLDSTFPSLEMWRSGGHQAPIRSSFRSRLRACFQSALLGVARGRSLDAAGSVSPPAWIGPCPARRLRVTAT